MQSSYNVDYEHEKMYGRYRLRENTIKPYFILFDPIVKFCKKIIILTDAVIQYGTINFWLWNDWCTECLLKLFQLDFTLFQFRIKQKTCVVTLEKRTANILSKKTWYLTCKVNDLTTKYIHCVWKKCWSCRKLFVLPKSI